ncbi:MAG: hypothetical protein DHS20C16_22300 [Phycisphaerae bacterium]|nr:MAG: hypothetical protein DHS20C16_22300 [Phycisphaerae bacterium]
MNCKPDSLIRMMGATMATLFVCGACSFNEPQPQTDPDPIPNPNPNPDPINTNGPDPVNTNGVEDPIEPGLEDLVGAWRVESGFLLEGYLPYAPAYLEFDEDGSAMAFGQNFATKANACEPLTYEAAGEGGIIFSSYDEDLSVNLFRFDGFDSLTVVEADGSESTFSRADSVPIENVCITLLIEDEIPVGVEWGGRGELEFDGDAFWFNSGDGKELTRVTATGVVHAPVPAPQSFSYLHAMQDQDFWTQDHAGGNETTKRFTQAGVEVDSVDTKLDLGIDTNLRAAAVDPNSEELWVQGRPRGEDDYRVLQIDTSAEPDVLVDSVLFDISLRSMSHDGEYLWGITSNRILQIDPATFEAATTYVLPDPEVYPVGIVVEDDKIFLLISDFEDGTTIMEVSTGLAAT